MGISNALNIQGNEMRIGSPLTAKTRVRISLGLPSNPVRFSSLFLAKFASYSQLPNLTKSYYYPPISTLIFPKRCECGVNGIFEFYAGDGLMTRRSASSPDRIPGAIYHPTRSARRVRNSAIPDGLGCPIYRAGKRLNVCSHRRTGRPRRRG